MQPNYVRVLRVLEEICNGISDLGGGGINAASASAATTEQKKVVMIDIKFIGEQAQAGALTWENCMNLVEVLVQQIQLIQAPR